MKKLLISFLLLFAFTSPVNAGRPSITAGDGPFHFGQTYGTFEIVESWSANRDLDYWARLQCNSNGSFVLDSFQSLSRSVQQDGWVLDSDYWNGGGGSCTILLSAWTNQGLKYFAEDTFVVLP